MASEIVKQTMIRLNRNINIMNEKGVIIASGNENRINQHHRGAYEVIKTGNPLIINESDQEKWEGSQPGVNLPISFQEQIIGVIGITGHPEEILKFGELVKMITEMMINQAFITEQVEWKYRLKEQIFEELIKKNCDMDSIHKRLNLIELKLSPPFQVAQIEIGPNQMKKGDVLQIIENVFEEEHTLVGFYNVNRIFVLTSNLPEAKLKQRLMTLLTRINKKGIISRIGIGKEVLENNHIRHSFYESLQALRLGNISENLITFTEIETKALLAGLDERTKNHYIDRVLGKLSDKMIETLEQFFLNNQNIGECAKTLYIHRNSLVYRLKKIHDITGYDPQLFSDAISLQLAVWLLQVSKNRNK